MGTLRAMASERNSSASTVIALFMFSLLVVAGKYMPTMPFFLSFSAPVERNASVFSYPARNNGGVL